MKTVFITNRGGTHPNRLTYFKSIGADFQFVDFVIRWHGVSNSKVKMILSGIICALIFPKRSLYDVFVTSDPQLPVILMKMFRLLRKDQKVVSYLGSQTLYFIDSKYFSTFTRLYYRFILRRYDAHICNGFLQASLLAKVANIPSEKIYVNFNGVSKEKEQQLSKVAYQFDSTNLIFVGNIYSKWRMHYKGLDLILESFNELKKREVNVTLTIVGKCDDCVLEAINQKVEDRFRSDLTLTGEVDGICEFLHESLLYVHPSRGDALPNSLTEALFAGIPAVVSDLTGGFELVHQIDSKLVCKPNSNSITMAILHYIKLPVSIKRAYSEKAKLLTKNLTEESAINRFQLIMNKVYTD